MKRQATEWLGVQVLSVTRIGNGRSSENWRVETKDGERLLLKRVKPSHERNLARQLEVMTAVGAPWAPGLFRNRLSWSTDEGLMLAVEWVKGHVVRFEKLTPSQAYNLGRSYRAFSEALQRYDGPMAATRLPEIPEADQKVIHGDLNDANVLFDGERVAAFIDYEMVRLGLPAEDIVRGFIHRAKRLSPLAIFSQRRLVRNFLIVACAAGYAKEEYRLAINAYRRRKQAQRAHRHGPLVRWLESLVRDPVYRRFERAVEGLAKDFSSYRAAHALERVGWGGVRRVCYKVGDTGCCVKFYKSPEIFAAQARRRSRIERECAAKRFDLKRNNSAQEVRVYERYMRTMPSEVTSKLPAVVELVFDPEWGYGILETYYTNPDGTAIIPYEFEIARQTPENREIIYAQAKELLEILAANRAFFYEPGNFHNLIRRDSTIETKIVDFEPTSKLLIKLDRIWPWWRGWLLRSKAKKYLRHIREKYGVVGELSGKR